MLFSTSFLVLSSFVPSPPAGSQHKVLSELDAVHAHSMTGTFTATPDGSRVFAAEGGALAILDNGASPNWTSARRLGRIGSEGIVPLELLLDPTAFQAQTEGRYDYLYVAGGRYGLWAIDLSMPGEHFTAVRIDDSGNSDPSTQTSRRWCNDLAVVSLGESEYLFALFGKKNGSRLRGYPLDAVRAAVQGAGGAETGQELAPTYDKILMRGPAGSSAHPGFAFAMDADTWVDGSDVIVDFIVAMGHHGLVRARFLPSGGGYTYLANSWGPVFGNDTAAAALPVYGAAYDDLEYRASAQGELERSDPPLFVDVAIESDGGSTRRAYVALDHLGWARFDLTGPWHAGLLPDHQEGVLADIGTWEKRFNLVDDAGEPQPIHTYAEEIDFLDHPTEGPLLAVTVGSRPLVIEPGLAIEGRVLDHSTRRFSGVMGSTWKPHYEGKGLYTIVYDLSQPLTSYAVNATRTVRAGGGRALLLERDAGAGRVQLVVGNHNPDASLMAGPQGLPLGNPFSTFLMEVELAATPTLPGGYQVLHARDGDFRAGRSTLAASRSVLDPRVLVTGGNDAGFPVDGILVTDCEGEIVRHWNGPGSDDRLAEGVTYGYDSQWIDGDPGDEDLMYSIGTGQRPNGEAAWSLKQIRIPPNPCNQSPELLRRLFFEAPIDRLGARSRLYWGAGESDALYDQENARGWKVLFMAQDGTPDGIWILRKDLLQAELEGSAWSDGDYVEQDDVPAAYVQTLPTHVEFVNVPDAEGATSPSFKLLHVSTPNLVGVTSTFVPELFRVEGGGSEADRWLLAAPCFLVALDSEHSMFTQHPTWLPPPALAASYDKALVRLFDVTDPGPGGVLDLGSIVGPRTGTSALRTKALVRGGRSYLFVANFGGSVLAYDLEDVLAATPTTGPNTAVHDAAIAEWHATPSITDDQVNNILAIEVDHVAWTDAEGSHEETYVYAAVWRLGLQVLRFVPDGSGGGAFEAVELVQTPISPVDLCLREVAGERKLLVSDSIGGLRVYRYGS